MTDSSPADIHVGVQVSNETDGNTLFGWIAREIEEGDGTSRWVVAWEDGVTEDLGLSTPANFAAAGIEINGCGRPELASALEELQGYLDSYEGELTDLLMRILLSLPGSELLEDFAASSAGRLVKSIQSNPLAEGSPGIGWYELDLLGRILDGIEGTQDIRMTVAVLWQSEPNEDN